MRTRVGLPVLWILLALPPGLGARSQDEFDPRRVNRYILELAEDPSRDKALSALHEYCKKHGKLEALYAKFKASLEARTGDAKLRVLLGRLYLRDGNMDGALETFRSAIRADPDYAYSYVCLAKVYEKLSDEPAAARVLEKVIERSDDAPFVLEAVRKLAAGRRSRGNVTGAANLWKDLFDRFPNDVSVVREAVSGLEECGASSQALTCLQSFLSENEVSPADGATLYLELAPLQRKLGNGPGALDSLWKAAEASRDNPVLARKIDEDILAFYRDEARLDELKDRYEKDLRTRGRNAVRSWRLARVYDALNIKSRAERELRRGLLDDWENPLLLEALSDFYWSTKDYAQVCDMSRRILSAHPKKTVHRKRFGLALLHLGKLEQADTILEAYARGAGKKTEVARIYDTFNFTALATRYFYEAVEQDPSRERTLEFAEFLMRRGLTDGAETVLGKLSRSDAERWQLLFRLALRFERTAKAQEYAARWVKAAPASFEARFERGKLLAERGGKGAAAALREALDIAKGEQRGKVFEELIRVESNSVRSRMLEDELRDRIGKEQGEGSYYIALSRLYEAERRNARSRIEILEWGLKRDPDDVRIRRELAPLYVETERYLRAIDLYGELVDLDPLRHNSYVSEIGQIYWDVGHKEQAFNWWAKVRGSGKSDVGLLFRLAKNCEAEEKYSQAVELLKKIIALEPEEVVYHVTLAGVCRKSDSYDELLTQCKWIISRARDEKLVREARVILNTKGHEYGLQLFRNSDYRKALEQFAYALRYAPDADARGAAHAQMARCWELLRNYAEAAKHYHLILSRYPDAIVRQSEDRTIRASLFARLRMFASTGVLEAYDREVGPKALLLYRKADIAGDRKILEEVLRTYPLSTVADDAAFRLGQVALKEERYADAVEYFTRVLSDHAAPSRDGAVVRMRLVEAAFGAKDWATAESALEDLKATRSGRIAQVGTKKVRVKDFVTTWKKRLTALRPAGSNSWGFAGGSGEHSYSSRQRVRPPLFQRWKRAISAPGDRYYIPPVYTSGGTVVFAAGDGKVVALDAGSGRLRWTAPLDAVDRRFQRNPTRPLYHYPSFNPKLDGRLIVHDDVVVGIHEDREVRAFSVVTGKLLWSVASSIARDEPVKVQSQIVLRGEEHLEVLSAASKSVFVREKDRLRALDLQTGKLIWEMNVPREDRLLAYGVDFKTQQFGTPIRRFVLVSRGFLVHAYAGTITVCQASTGRVYWRRVIPVERRHDPATVQMTTNISDGVALATISRDKLVYGTLKDGRLRAVDLRTEQHRWEIKVPKGLRDADFASDLDFVYIRSGGLLEAYEVQTGRRAWSRAVRAPVAAQGTRGVIPYKHNQLSVSNSAIYVVENEILRRTSARLVVLDRKTGKQIWVKDWGMSNDPGNRRARMRDPWGRGVYPEASTPAIGRSAVFIVKPDGTLQAYRGRVY